MEETTISTKRYIELLEHENELLKMNNEIKAIVENEDVEEQKWVDAATGLVDDNLYSTQGKIKINGKLQVQYVFKYKTRQEMQDLLIDVFKGIPQKLITKIHSDVNEHTINIKLDK